MSCALTMPCSGTLPYNGAMHILHVTPYYRPAYAFGGVVRALEGLAAAQVARGLRVTVLTTDALTPTARYGGTLASDEDGVRVIRVRNLVYPLRRLNLSTPLGMRRAAHALLGDVDIVHLHELRTLEALLVTPQAARRGIPIALSPHGTLTTTTGRGALKRLWDRWLSLPVLMRLAAVAGLNADETAEAQRFCQLIISNHHQARIRFATIPNGIDAATYAHLDGRARFRAAWGLGDAPVVLFLGRLHARKGIDVLARAFMQVGEGARLVIAGPDEGMLSTLRELAARDKRIIITGFLDGSARLDALAAADVFALPATGEGLPMAALEAMAAGLPLLLSPGCHLPEAGDAGAAMIVEPQAAPLAEALSRLLADDERRAEMGAAAQRLALERFSWASAAAAWENLYEEIRGG